MTEEEKHTQLLAAIVSMLSVLVTASTSPGKGAGYNDLATKTLKSVSGLMESLNKDTNNHSKE